MDLGLTDKVAIITGSSRGLGLASATALAAEGCRVCICARGQSGWPRRRSKSRPRRAAQHGHRCPGGRFDAAGIELVVTRTLDRFGGLDILVNNVGRATGGDIGETSDAEWQAAFDETLFPAIRASRLAVPAHEGARRRIHHHDRVDLGTRVRRAHDLQRRQGRRDQPRQGDGAAARAATSASTAWPPGRSCSPAAPGTNASRRIPKASRNSSSATCPSAASAAPTKSVRSPRGR